MASRWSQRASAYPSKASASGSTRGSLSPKGTIKRKKQERKALEQRALTMRNLSSQIGRLEDRDTQQQAFAALVEALPRLDASMVSEVYALIEKNKIPARASARRMLVLLIAALCKCHPVPAAKLLPRILAYLCLRFRDRQTKVTDACVVLVSIIVLYVLPCPSVSLPTLEQLGTSPRRGSSKPTSADKLRERSVLNAAEKVDRGFEAVAAVLQREANAVGEVATRCLCGLLRPVDFDGVSVPGPEATLAHATRIGAFFKRLLGESVAKLDGSTAFASFSPVFLLLQSACQLARDAYEKASLADLGAAFEPYVASIFEAIEDASQCGSRDDWVLRKRGLELLTLLLDAFALHENSWCGTVRVSRTYFHANLERVRALVLAGRHDPALLVREAAIPAALAFEFLEDQSPKGHNSSCASLLGHPSANYDFVLPNPPGYSFTSRDRPRSPGALGLGKEACGNDAISPPFGMATGVAARWSVEPRASRESRNGGELSFDGATAGDEALPPVQPESADTKGDEEIIGRTKDTRRGTTADNVQADNRRTVGRVVSSKLVGPVDISEQQRRPRRPSARKESNATPNNPRLDAVTLPPSTPSAPKRDLQEKGEFGELAMDEVAAPEDREGEIGDKAEAGQEGVPEGRVNSQGTQKRFSAIHRGDAHGASPPATTAAVPVSSVIDAATKVSTLRQFVAKQRAQVRSRHRQDKAGSSTSTSRREPSNPIEDPSVFAAGHTANYSPGFTSDHALRGINCDDYKANDHELEDYNPNDEAWVQELQCTRAEAALEAAQCGEPELAIRLCLLEDNLTLLRRTMATIQTPCMAELSKAARDALCTAFLLLLDGAEEGSRLGEDEPDSWLALRWLQDWATAMPDGGNYCRHRQLELLDPRVAQALSEKLGELATAPSKTALAARRVLAAMLEL